MLRSTFPRFEKHFESRLSKIAMAVTMLFFILFTVNLMAGQMPSAIFMACIMCYIADDI